MNNASRPGVKPVKAWQFPLPCESFLPNGLRVWRYHLPGQHITSVHLVLDVPLVEEPEDFEGVATITLRASDEGTHAHPGTLLGEALESSGSEYGGSADESATFASVHTPSTRLHQALPLFAEIIRTPEFAESDIERHVALRLAEIDQARARSSLCATKAFREALFAPGSRAHRPSGGSPESVIGINSSLVQDFHARMWRPHGSTLVIAGDLPETIEDLIARTFDGWEGTAQSHHIAPQPRGEKRRVSIVDRPGSVQADVRIGCVSVNRRDPAWASLQVAATAIGGSFGSRLNTRLREELGYTYGASCAFTPRRSCGVFSMSASFRTGVVAEAIDETLSILSLAQGPITEQETTNAITYLIGTACLHYDTSEPIAAQAGALAAANMPFTLVNDLHSMVQQVDHHTATQAFRNHVDVEDVHIAICGDAEILIPQLASRGFDVHTVKA